LILELDLGNTRAKWRIVKEPCEIVAQGVANLLDWLEGRFPEVWSSGVERSRIASVLSPETENELIAKMQSHLSISSRIATSTSSCCGVINAYENPERLGVDRWLALIAAYKMLGKAVLVIDIGTALKIDVVNDTGHHLGGYIIPGASLMEHALLDGTDRVRYESGQSIESVMLGRDTRACVQHGITAALVGAVLVANAQCQAVLGKQPLLVITGGLAAQLKECLKGAGIRDINLKADLVLDGLRWALP
jgi:type III pantothenate kinase